MILNHLYQLLYINQKNVKIYMYYLNIQNHNECLTTITLDLRNNKRYLENGNIHVYFFIFRLVMMKKYQ